MVTKSVQGTVAKLLALTTHMIRRANAWMKPKLIRLKDWIIATWMRADQKADQKLGIVSASTLSVLGGGIPAWLVSRVFIVAVTAAIGGYAVHRHNEGIRATRDKQWVAKLEKERNKQVEIERKAAEDRKRAVAEVETTWRADYVKLNDYSQQLEKALEKSTTDTVEAQKHARSLEAAVAVLRNKAAALDKRRLRR